MDALQLLTDIREGLRQIRVNGPAGVPLGLETHDHKRPVGDFLTAVLHNNLTEAVARADDENIKNLPAFVGYLYNEAPSLCWGSKERVAEWLNGD